MLDGTANADSILGLGGDDELAGRSGADLLLGGAGADMLFGGNGDDVLVGGDGNDSLTGEDGDDFFVFYGIAGEGVDVINNFNTGLAGVGPNSEDRFAIDDDNQFSALTVGGVTSFDAIIRDVSSLNYGGATGNATFVLDNSAANNSGNLYDLWYDADGNGVTDFRITEISTDSNITNYGTEDFFIF